VVKRLTALRILVVSVALLVSLMFSSLVGVQLAGAQDSMYFSDHFSSSAVDPSKWQVQEQNLDLSGSPAWGGNITVANSYLHMSSNGSAFPFIQTVTNPFPASGDFILQFSLQYTCIADWGDGVMLGNGTPTLDPNTNTWHNKIFDVWAADKGAIINPATGQWTSNQTNIYIELLNSAVYEVDYPGFKPSSPEQTYELAYVNGTYTVYVNGIQVAQAQSDIRPTTILIGEPPIFDLPQSPQNMAAWGSWWGWTDFQMDYITIQQPTSSETTPSPTPVGTSSSPSQPQFSIDSNSTITSLSFNSTSEEISFTVSGPSGTTGYLNLTISKNLLPNLAGLKIYLDKQDVNFTANTVGDFQVLYFSYHHSTHQVVISLPSLATGTVLQLWTSLPIFIGSDHSSPSPFSAQGQTAQPNLLQILYGVVTALVIVTVVMVAFRLIINGKKAREQKLKP
jgi:hypothetical protein